MNPIHTQFIVENLQIPKQRVENTLQLFADGATIPFIARYRKEMTGSLDEVQVEAIQKESNRLIEIDKRRETILKSIEEQGKLTPELRQRIQKSWDMTELEDIYLPYKQKRKTRASIAKARGLEPLAEELLKQRNHLIEDFAAKFITDEVLTIEDALQGARDIIAEMVSEDEAARNKARQAFKRYATVKSKLARGKEEAGAVYKNYFEFEESLQKIPSHRLLAILRAESEGILRVNVTPEAEQTIPQLERIFVKGYGKAADQVKMAVEDGYKRLLEPSIETEFRNQAKEKADTEAIQVFADNLKQLLLSAPLGQRRVIGIDPGYRTGCKVVCLDESGNLINNTTIYPHPPQQQTTEAAQTLQYLVEKFAAVAIAVGNGTAGKETVAFCKSITFQHPVDIFIVNEAGASIYSASDVARAEFPDHDVTVRGAVSIGRRLVDPLAELVKIDPKSIGVGQYQHDVNQVRLRESLDRVVESCVNAVGINVNTASKHLLTYVSGLGPSLAQNIVDYRASNGQFTSRSELKNVSRMGAKAFEQAAGFLRIKDAKHLLDNTAVHPESYGIVEQMAKDLGVSIPELIKEPSLRASIDLKKYVNDKVGLPTLHDIMQELAKPGLDPRGHAKTFEFAKGVNSIQDLYIGMVLPGIITNITNFGAFVDIGIKESGLVHISQISNTFISNPAEVLQLNQEVEAKVIDIDLQRGRVALTMKDI
jgi:uncharacterized protein